jgi:hypothetical protein
VRWLEQPLVIWFRLCESSSKSTFGTTPVRGGFWCTAGRTPVCNPNRPCFVTVYPPKIQPMLVVGTVLLEVLCLGMNS